MRSAAAGPQRLQLATQRRTDRGKGFAENISCRPHPSTGRRRLKEAGSCKRTLPRIPGAFAGGMARSQGSFTMRPTLVRYRTHPDRAEENQHLIEKVFQELRAGSPDGLRYLALKLDDGI